MPEQEPFPGRVVFGGPLSPLGWTVGFVDAPLAVVLDAMQRHWEYLEHVDPIEEHNRRLRAEGVRIEISYGPLAPREQQKPTYRITELGREPILEQLGRLDPLQSPPMRELATFERRASLPRNTNTGSSPSRPSSAHASARPRAPSCTPSR